MHLALAHPLVFVFGIAAALALAWWSYRGTVPAQTGARRALLVALRTASLALVFFLLADPLLRRIVTEEEPPVLAVVVDASASIALQDSLAGGGLRARLDALLADLPEGVEPRLYQFSAQPERLPGLDSLRLDGPRTDIARALEGVAAALQDENLQGMVLVSDGNYNAGRNPLYPAERLGTALFPVVVGDTSALRDVRLRRVETNRIVYTGTVVPVRATVQGLGYGGQPVQVSLLRGSTVLDAQRIVLPPGGAELFADLAFTPEQDGLERLTVAVSRLDGEATFRNNAETITLQVRANRRRVLLLGAAPEPDVSALRQALEADASIEVTVRVQKAAGQYYEGALPAFTDFEAVVLAGYPGTLADAAALERLQAAARSGVGLAFFATARTDYRALARLRAVLPAATTDFPPRFTEAFPVPTPAGSTHPMLDVPDAPPLASRRLPPLLSPDVRWALAPDARVLATAEVRGVRLGDPILVVRSAPRLRTAMLLATGTWRWNTLPRDLEDAEGYWPVFVSNVIKWITAMDESRRVRVEPVETVFGGGETVRFTGQVYDESLQPVEGAQVQVDVTAADGTVRPYPMQHIGQGRYALDAGTLPPGDYRFSARALLGDQTLGSDAGAFSVGTLALEYQEPRADYRLMQGLAQRTSGRLFTLAALDSLPGHLDRLPNFSPTVVARAAEQPLRDAWPLLVALVALLTAEWVTRKRGGLA